MSTNVGSVQISLKLDRSPFDKAIADLRSLKLPDLSVKLSVDTSAFKQAQEAAKDVGKEIQKAAGTKGKINPFSLNLGDFQKSIGQIRSSLTSIRNSVRIPIGLDSAPFKSSFDSLKASLASVRSRVAIPISGESSAFQNLLNRLKAQTTQLKTEGVKVPVGANTSEFKAAFDKVKAERIRIANEKFTVPFAVNTEAVKQSIGTIRNEKNKFLKEDSKAKIGIDDGSYRDALGKLRNEKGKFIQDPFKIPVKADTAEVKPSIERGLSALKGGGAFSNIATGIGQGIGQAIAGGIGQAVGEAKKAFTTFVSFDAALNQFNKIVKVGDEELTAFREEFLKLGIATSKSPTEVAAAAKAYAQLGKTSQETKRDLEPLVRFLEAGGFKNAEEGAKVASTASKQFGRSIQEVSDIIVAASDAGGADAPDFLQALSKGGTPAAVEGQSLEALAAVYTKLRESGSGAEESATALRNIFSRLTPATDKAKDSLKAFEDKFDFKIRDEDTGKIKNIIDLLPKFKEGLDQLSPEDRTSFVKEIFGDEAAAQFQFLIQQVDDVTKGFNSLSQAAKSGGKSTEEGAKQLLQGLSGATDNLKSSIETVGIRVIGALEPILSGVIVSITQGLSAIGLNAGLFDGIKQQLTGFVTFVNTTLEPVRTAIASAFSSVDLSALQTSLQNISTLISTAFGGAATSAAQSFATNFASGLNVVVGILTRISQFFEPIVAAALPTLGAVFGLISQIGASLFSALQSASPAIEGIVAAFVGVQQAIFGIVEIIANILTGILKENQDAINGIVQSVTEVAAVVGGAVLGAFNILKSLIETNQESIKGFLGVILNVLAAVGKIISTAFKLAGIVVGIGQAVTQKVIPAFKGIANAMGSVLGFIRQAINLVTQLATKIGEILSKIPNVGAGVQAILDRIPGAGGKPQEKGDSSKDTDKAGAGVGGAVSDAVTTGSKLKPEDSADAIKSAGDKNVAAVKQSTDAVKDAYSEQLASLQTRLNIGEIGQEDYIREKAKLDKGIEASGKTTEKAGAKVAEKVDAATQAIKDAYQQQRDELKAEFKAGSLTQDEFNIKDSELVAQMERDIDTDAAERGVTVGGDAKSAPKKDAKGFVKLADPKEEKKAEQERKKKEREAQKAEKDRLSGNLDNFNDSAAQEAEKLAEAQAQKLDEVKRLQLQGAITAEEAAKRESQIAIQGTQDQLAAKRAQLEEVKRLRASGSIDAEKAADKELQLQKEIRTLGTQLLEQQLKERQRKEEEALKKLEKANQEANDAIVESQRNRTIAVKQLQADGAIDAEEAAKRLEQINRESINAELEAKKKQLEEVKKLRAEGTISNEKGLQIEKQLQKELAELTLKRLDDEIKKQEQLRKEAMQAIDDRVAAEKRRSDEAIANIDREIAKIKELGQQVIDIQQRLLNSRGDLQKSVNSLDTTRAEIGLERSKRNTALAKTANDKNASPEERQKAQNQLAQAGQNPNLTETQALDQEFEQFQKLQAEKEKGLLLEQEIARQNLELDLKKAELAAKINELEAQRNVLIQRQNLLKAEGNLQKAQELAPGRERDRAIADAGAEVNLARQGLDLANQSLEVTRLGNAQNAELASNARQTLANQQQAQRERFAADQQFAQEDLLNTRNDAAAREGVSFRFDNRKPTFSQTPQINSNLNGLTPEQQQNLGGNFKIGQSGQQPFSFGQPANGISPTGGALGGESQTQKEASPFAIAEGLLTDILTELRDSLAANIIGTFYDAYNDQIIYANERLFDLCEILRNEVIPTIEAINLQAPTGELPQSANPTAAPATVAPSKADKDAAFIAEMQKLGAEIKSISAQPRQLTVSSPDPVKDAATIWRDIAKEQARYRRNRPDEGFGLG